MTHNIVRLTVFLVLIGNAWAQEEFEFLPGASYDPQVPNLESVVGHTWGENITMHHEVERYLLALAQASPKVELRRHGETWEGKALFHIIVASEANIARLDQIQSAMQQIADPRRTPPNEADRIIDSMPSVVWLSYGVHGNEISSTDAGLLTAYHLAASRSDGDVEAILANSVVIIDPLQNPDGRDRFIAYYRQTRGRWPDSDRQSAEHNEVWPGGRTNHYLFDMNRDWFAQTQKETRGRLSAYLQWFPQVFVDLHEMGTDSSYYFAPPADPLNPEMPPSQVEMLETFGRRNAEWFDRFGFDYFTREVFDSFYPGYGEGWPMFKGSVGMTYEQASTRGLTAEREDETVLRYRDGVQHHFISSLSTALTAAEKRRELLRYFYDFRRTAIEEGRSGPVREFILPSGTDANRTRRLVSKLMGQGIEVKRAKAGFSNPSVRGYYSETPISRDFPAGTYLIGLDQPDKRLITVLLEKHISMGEDFIEEQKRRQAKRLGMQIYDVTGWSVPLLYGIEAFRASLPSVGEFEVLEEAPAPHGAIHGSEAKVAYLIPWDSNSAARALAEIFRQGLRVHSAKRPFTIELAGGEKEFPAGSLIVKVKGNPPDLAQKMSGLAREFGIEAYAADSSWVKDGPNFGSNDVDFLKKPRIAMAYNSPVSPYSAGAARYLIEQEYGYPVTVIRADRLQSADLSKYNVLILPDAFGGYDRTFGEQFPDRLRNWMRDGGTLVALGAASRWLSGEKVGLLNAQPEKRKRDSGQAAKKEDKPQEESTSAEEEEVKQEPRQESDLEPKEEPPIPIPGAILRVDLDTEHWLAFGYPGGANVLIRGNDFFTPLKLDQGRNVGRFATREKLLLSGWGIEESFDQIAGKSYLMYQSYGDGHLVAFADDPNFRAFCDGLNLLFLNGLLFGPGR